MATMQSAQALFEMHDLFGKFGYFKFQYCSLNKAIWSVNSVSVSCFRLFKPFPMTHIAVVVGHGVDENGWPYWRLKNSWGEEWGEEGYLKIVKDVGHCGIATHVAIPTCERVEE